MAEKKNSITSSKRGNGNSNSTAIKKTSKPQKDDDFVKKYLKYINSTKGLGTLVTVRAIVFRSVLVIVSCVVLFMMYEFSQFTTLPAVFIYPLMLVVLVVFTLPFLIYLIKGIIARVRYQKLTQMVKKLPFEKHEKAYLVKSKQRFYTFLVYSETVPESKCLEEVKQVKEIYKKLGVMQNYSKAYYEVEKLNITGKLKITDFYTKKIRVIKNDDYDFPIVQACMKTPDIKTKAVSGISVGNKFIIFPPTVWKANEKVVSKKII